MTTATQVAVIPDAGRHIVETEHSAYLIDMDAKTFERWPAAPEASQLGNDGETVDFVAILCEVGHRMRLDRFDGGEHRARLTTDVVSITEAA